jgi:hypothetical protein
MSYSLYPPSKRHLALEFSPDRKWLHQNIKNKKNLLICIGDSWTWGDSLGTTTPEYNDEKTRYNQFYTNKLAEKLNSDWLMIAICGIDNTWILNQYKIVTQAINNGYYENYDNVYVHVCLTELFRELDNKQISYFIKKIAKTKNLTEFCNSYFELTVLNRLKKLSPLPKTHIFSKNFWDIDVDCSQHNFVKDVWQQLLFKKASIKDKELIPVVSGIGIDPLVTFLKENKLKDLAYEFSNLLVKISERIDNMIQCPLNHKKATKHPTAEGHQIWADYLYNYYKDL